MRKMAATVPDVLEIIPESNINSFCEKILAKELPYSLQAYYFIKTCSSWKKENQNVDVTFLYCKKNIESGIFVGLLKSGSRSVTMVTYALEHNEKLFGDVLKQSNLIPWNLLPLVRCVLMRHLTILKDVIKSKGVAAVLQPECHLYTVPIDVAASYEIILPPEIYIDTIKSEHIKSIYDTWPLHYVYTQEMVKLTVEFGFAYGVFSKSDNSLLAWIMRFDYGGIGQLQNKENEERHGYGKLLCKYLSKKLAKMSIQPYAFSRDINTPSKVIFEAIGFSPVCPTRSIIVSKH